MFILVLNVFLVLFVCVCVMERIAWSEDFGLCWYGSWQNNAFCSPLVSAASVVLVLL